jgi:hypothetical protein
MEDSLSAPPFLVVFTSALVGAHDPFYDVARLSESSKLSYFSSSLAFVFHSVYSETISFNYDLSVSS